MSMPSLVYRTNAITQRVLSSNHNTISNSETLKEKKEQESTSQLPADEPTWIKESIKYWLRFICSEERKRRKRDDC